MDALELRCLAGLLALVWHQLQRDLGVSLGRFALPIQRQQHLGQQLKIDGRGGVDAAALDVHDLDFFAAFQVGRADHAQNARCVPSGRIRAERLEKIEQALLDDVPAHQRFAGQVGVEQPFHLVATTAENDQRR
ncbi:hypothetical protein D3C84_910030 [compost metagenome]